MKKLTLAFLVGIACAAHCFGAYDKRLVHILAQLRECKMAFDVELPMVGGAAVGDAATPHEFYLLFPYVIRIASDADLIAMLRDKSPVVRIMAAKCIVQQKDSPLMHELDILMKDTDRVYVAPFGCVITKQTVSEVVGELKKDPDFLGDLKEADPVGMRSRERSADGPMGSGRCLLNPRRRARGRGFSAQRRARSRRPTEKAGK